MFYLTTSFVIAKQQKLGQCQFSPPEGHQTYIMQIREMAWSVGEGEFATRRENGV